MSATAPPASATVYHLKVALRDISPIAWQCLLIVSGLNNCKYDEEGAPCSQPDDEVVARMTKYVWESATYTNTRRARGWGAYASRIDDGVLAS